MKSQTTMIDSKQLEHALSIQNRCYKLLLWLGDAVREGFVPVVKAHAVTDVGHAAKMWVETHFFNLPADCRPLADEMEPFSNFFGTYLETSFDIISNPGTRYESTCGCDCGFCLRIVRPQQIRPKSLAREDKERAQRLRIRRLEMLAREEGLPSYELRIRESLGHEEWRHQASFSAYGAALLDRIKGISDGPAVLALWRDFAWTRAGAPNRTFRLKTKHITDSEKALLDLLRRHANE